MIKAGTPRERVAEILKASGVTEDDFLVFLSLYTDKLAFTHINGWELSDGFKAPCGYLYAVRLEKDGPRKIELVEPKEKTLREKIREVLRYHHFYDEAVEICAKVAEEHFKNDRTNF